MMPGKPNVEELRKDKDVYRLMEALRYPGSAIVRAQAARALGQLNDSLAVESLIRSSQLDPAAEVQAAARQALEDMFGSNAQNVIRAYPIYEGEEAWIANKAPAEPSEEEEEGEESYEDEGEFDEEVTPDEGGEEFQPGEEDDANEDGWTSDDLGPLVTILRSERDPRLRLRAARALGKLGATNMHAVEALAATALWGERPSVRAAALQALVNIYGDEDTDRLLETFKEMQAAQAAGQPSQDDTEAPDDESGQGSPPSSWAAPELRAPPPIPYDQSEPVIRDEGAGWQRWVVVVVIALLVIAGLVILFANLK